MLQRLPAPGRRFLDELLFLVRQHIEKDGAVSSVLLRVLISGRRALVAPSGVLLPLAVLVAGLSAPPLRRHGLVPLVLYLPIPQGLIVDAHLLGKLPQVYFFAPAPAGNVFSLGGVAFLAPLRHSAHLQKTDMPRRPYINIPRRHAGLRRQQGKRKAHSVSAVG